VWSCPPLIPALGWLRQEYHEFETSLGYEGDPASKQKKKRKKKKKRERKKKATFRVSMLVC
jgi:hypothetical protein